MDETAQAVIQLMQTVMAEIAKDNFHRERIKAAAHITAAILQNPKVDPFENGVVYRAALYAGGAVNAIEQGIEVKGRGGAS